MSNPPIEISPLPSLNPKREPTLISPLLISVGFSALSRLRNRAEIYTK